eukprot:6182288-Pleurochrysis_carterae.AAC.1
MPIRQPRMPIRQSYVPIPQSGVPSRQSSVPIRQYRVPIRQSSVRAASTVQADLLLAHVGNEALAVAHRLGHQRRRLQRTLRNEKNREKMVTSKKGRRRM